MIQKSTPLNLALSDKLYKFLYLLRDLGIKSAHEPAVEAWQMYMYHVTEIAKQGVISDNT